MVSILHDFFSLVVGSSSDLPIDLSLKFEHQLRDIMDILIYLGKPLDL